MRIKRRERSARNIWIEVYRREFNCRSWSPACFVIRVPALYLFSIRQAADGARRLTPSESQPGSLLWL